MNDFLKALLGDGTPPKTEVRMIKAGPEIGERMQELHAELERSLSSTRVTGVSGGGMVEVELALDGKPHQIRISAELHTAVMREPLEDLLLAALQNAHERTSREADRIRSAHAEKVGRLMEDLASKMGG